MKGGIEKCSSALKNLLKTPIVKIIPPVEVYNSGYFLFGINLIFEILFMLLSPGTEGIGAVFIHTRDMIVERRNVKMINFIRLRNI